MAWRLQTSPGMSDKRLKKLLDDQRRRSFADVVTLIALAGGLAISLAGML